MIKNDAGVKGRAVDAPPPVIEGDHAAALTTRVSELEDRISRINVQAQAASGNAARAEGLLIAFAARRSEEHTTELQSLMRISYAVFCLKNKKTSAQTSNKTMR